MSGSQIGTVVGGAIGYYFGGVAGGQIGMAIGGAIGGAVDPTKIKGPHIGDGQSQSATDGVPIAWVQGEARVAGTIVAVSKRREVKKSDSGKGSGTEQVTFEAHQDFAILVCESSQLRGTYIDAITRIEQDGAIKFESDPGSPIHEDSITYREGFDILNGDEDQLPNPTLEAISGVGKTLCYRGYLVVVFRDFNLTAAGDRIPTFMFTVKTSNIIGYSYVRYNNVFKYLEQTTPDPGPNPPYTPGFDDSLWKSGLGGFGTGLPGYIAKTAPTNPVSPGLTFWVRAPYHSTPGTPAQVTVLVDDFADLWWNGEWMGQRGQTGSFGYQIPAEKVLRKNMAVVRGFDSGGANIFLGVEIHPNGEAPPVGDDSVLLGDIVTNICLRGGLPIERFDVSELMDTVVIGYTIATAASGTECLNPLLAAYFCYASEYAGLLWFRKLGQDALLTVNPLDLIESDTGSDGASVISTSRNQETEYPRKINATYYDPDQNFQAVTVPYERTSASVKAIGEQSFQIPVVMTAAEARQATVKALKATWAALEGTREYSLPLVGREGECYLSLAAGDPLFFQAKRWLVSEITLGHNMLHLKTTYDRQSSYRTNLQALPAPAPTPPVSRVGGPTTLYAMNLPSLRPQDTYGLYLAVGGQTTAWNGCLVQISYDDGQSWRDGLTASEASVLGILTTVAGPTHASFGVSVNGELSTITPEQFAAQGNPFAILSAADVADMGQFRVATQTAEGHYTLSEATFGARGTQAAEHAAGERFTMLDSVYFLPVDLSYGETTLKLRAITLGGKAEDAQVVTIVYHPDDQVILDGGGDAL